MSINSFRLCLADASKTIRERFATHMTRPDSKGCINWVGAITGSGYGKIYYGYFSGKPWQVAAHRVAWVLNRGDLNPLDLVCHTCDNRLCINVDHLFIGTPADNVADMLSKDRHFGKEWRKSKAVQVERINDLASAGLYQRDIAKHLGISKTSVCLTLSKSYRYARLLTQEI